MRAQSPDGDHWEREDLYHLQSHRGGPKPTLSSPNKTSPRSFYSEFRSFSPIMPSITSSATTITTSSRPMCPRRTPILKKTRSINEEIDRLAMRQRAPFERRDVIIVASVSCIYGLRLPEDYVDYPVLEARRPAGSGQDPVGWLPSSTSERWASPGHLSGPGRCGGDHPRLQRKHHPGGVFRG